MNNAKPLYKLRQLMYHKYGENKFATACIIVAQWVQHYTRTPCSPETIEYWCNIKKQENTVTHHFLQGHITMQEFAALSKIFSLNHNTQLFYDEQ
jgi:hypothetical protein